MLKSGIYGLFRLDGAPVDSREAGELGLSLSDVSDAALARGVDTQAANAVQRAEDADGLTMLVGYLEEPEALAARLNLSAEVPPAVLARHALLTFGSAMPAMAVGEWSLLHWERMGRLTLMVSAARRDRVLYAICGARVAVAPDLFRLSRLPWVGSGLDEEGLLFALGRVGVREGMADRTMISGVRELEAGSSVTITAGQSRTAQAAAFTPQPRWTGTFEDAVAEAERLMRQIMRDRLARTAKPAALLSGGLDSSTLAWLAAEEREGGQELLLLTSVAPAGSGLADEAEFADAVAARLGLASTHVAPPEAANIYRPPDYILGGASRPPLSNRQCLTETFQATARARGATLLFDGIFGEMTVSGTFALTTVRRRLRGVAAHLRQLARVQSRPPPPIHPFHVRLSPYRLAHLPEQVRAQLCVKEAKPPTRRSNDLWGYLPGAAKAMMHPNEFYAGALRMERPYRDLRLLRLFASFPAAFLVQDGLNRAPVRRMLDGRLPDSIRLRRSGLPASPDHTARLQRQASAARSRIPTFRKAEVHEWLDLDWLDAALGRVGERGPADVTEASEVQLTAITAEFLTWWRERT